MSESFEHISEAALLLPFEERAALAARIVESIDDASEAVSAAWMDVAEKRRDEVLAGAARTVDASEVSAYVRRHIS